MGKFYCFDNKKRCFEAINSSKPVHTRNIFDSLAAYSENKKFQIFHFFKKVLENFEKSGGKMYPPTQKELLSNPQFFTSDHKIFKKYALDSFSNVLDDSSSVAEDFYDKIWGLSRPHLSKIRIIAPKFNFDDTKGKKGTFTSDELRFLKRNKINPNSLASRWEWARRFDYVKNKKLIEDFFRHVIYPKLGFRPNVDDIKSLGFRGLIGPIRDLGMNVRSMIREAYKDGDFRSRQRSTWKEVPKGELRFLNQHGIKTEYLRSRWDWVSKENESIIIEFFKDLVLPSFGRIPTREELREIGLRGFIDAIERNFSYIDLVNKISQKLYGKNYNYVRNIPIKVIDKIKHLVSLKAKIFLSTNKVPRSINYFSNKLGVGWETFANHALEHLKNEYGFKKGQWIFDNMWESEDMISQKVGLRVHILINDLLTNFYLNLGLSIFGKAIKYYREPYIYPHNMHPDGLLLLTQKLKVFLKNSNLWFESNILSNFNAIIFDFTIDSSNRNIKKKVRKYARNNLLFIIVVLRDVYNEGERILPPEIANWSPYVKILDYKKFSEVIGLDFKYRERFLSLMKLTAKEDFQALDSLSIMDKEHSFSTIDLKKDIRKYANINIRDFFNI